MFGKRKNNPDWDLEELSDEKLRSLPFIELQRIKNKRWANGLKELEQRAKSEISRRSPKTNWKCLRCENTEYHEKHIRVAGGFAGSFLGLETEKYHAIICNYCGKAEFYNVHMNTSEKVLGLFGN